MNHPTTRTPATPGPTPAHTPMSHQLQLTLTYTIAMLPMGHLQACPGNPTPHGVAPHYAHTLCHALQRHHVPESDIVAALLQLILDVHAERLMPMQPLEDFTPPEPLYSVPEPLRILTPATHPGATS